MSVGFKPFTARRKFAIHLEGLAASMKQCGRKTRIHRIIADLMEFSQQAEELNIQYLAHVPEPQ